jgi:hypothetical protein
MNTTNSTRRQETALQGPDTQILDSVRPRHVERFTFSSSCLFLRNVMEAELDGELRFHFEH